MLLEQARLLLKQYGALSPHFLMRKFKIDHDTAAKIIEDLGLVIIFSEGKRRPKYPVNKLNQCFEKLHSN